MKSRSYSYPDTRTNPIFDPKVVIAALFLLLAACGAGNEATPPSAPAVESAPQAQATDWLARLTLEQKIQIVSGTGFSLEGRKPEEDRVPGAAGYTVDFSAMGLKSIALADGPAGLRIQPERAGDDAKYFATAFPVATALASSWNTGIVERVGEAMGEEIREYGVDVFLAPGMNLHRNPLGGRNFEYYSEDPLLSGRMAAAMVKGVQSLGVGATIKHYVANNQETNRHLVDVLVSERALRELYLRGFEIAVREAKPWAVMSSYNKVNGSYTSQSPGLLTAVLRGEWGFEGLVMTDWFAGDDPVAQLKAGNDLLMPGMPERTERIRAALESGDLTEDELNTNVLRILQLILKSPTQAGYAHSNRPDLEAHAATARAAAAEGTVLLKNANSALPLADDVATVAAFGNTSYEFISGGTGSGDVNEAYTVSLVDGLEAAGLRVDEELRGLYAEFMTVEKAKLPEKKFRFELLPPIPEMPVAADLLAQEAAANDVALITIGRNSGEFQDRKVDGDFDLTAAEQALVDSVAAAFHARQKSVIVILNVGNVVETASWRDKVDAIVLPWQGGQEGGNAVTDVLTGRVNPSGKLPTTFPLRYSDVPSADSFPGIELSDEEISGIGGLSLGKLSEVKYREGIFVGYRYYETFSVQPAYPFGYGLSYTGFDLMADDREAIVNDDGNIRVPVTIRNHGELAGREVVQLYVSAPNGTLPKPAKELRAFAKTDLIQPGESKTLTLVMDVRELASFDPSRRCWIADEGTYVLHLGTSSVDNRVEIPLTLTESRRFDVAIARLEPERPVSELRQSQR